MQSECRQDTKEEYQFEKIVKATYKDQFYNDMYGKMRQIRPNPVANDFGDLTSASTISPNKKPHYATIYGSSYGKSQSDYL